MALGNCSPLAGLGQAALKSSQSISSAFGRPVFEPVMHWESESMSGTGQRYVRRRRSQQYGLQPQYNCKLMMMIMMMHTHKLLRVGNCGFQIHQSETCIIQPDDHLLTAYQVSIPLSIPSFSSIHVSMFTYLLSNAMASSFLYALCKFHAICTVYLSLKLRGTVEETMGGSPGDLSEELVTQEK